MKIIVTGGAGFIGSHLVDRLLADGAEVIVVDNFDPFYDRAQQGIQPRPGPAKPAVPAGRARHPRCARRARRWSRNAGPTRSCTWRRGRAFGPASTIRGSIPRSTSWGRSPTSRPPCRLEPRPRFIYASSSSVYGDRADGPFRESDPVDLPVSPYAATKRACELLAHTFHHLHGLPVTGLRFFTAYGPRNRPDLAIAKFTRLIDQGQPVPMFGDGTSRRDYTYVDDIVDGIVRAIDRCRAHHLYNLGNSQPIALRDTDRRDRPGTRKAGQHRDAARTAGRRPPDLRRDRPGRRRTRLRAQDAVRRRAAPVRRLVSVKPEPGQRPGTDQRRGHRPGESNSTAPDASVRPRAAGAGRMNYPRTDRSADSGGEEKTRVRPFPSAT